ncbi:hypothetical protein GOBAR_AA27869 [Gossypium barbadense]|uniref:Uncharacterized protein n=1 Tax=Gossypium barbadense TaxID=3634 RepID=A0A2P5WP03_GOSBA|nr:hypothetical protein GOBAR_AA27869 [Gossypium barbadense]
MVEVHQFFKDLFDIVNIASASSKWHDELQKAQAAEITRLVSINELEIGTGMNQIGTLQHPDMNAQYIVGRSRKKKEDVTVEHHYIVDIFFDTIDTQLQELKSRFNEHVVELLTLTTTLDPKEFFKLFDINKICSLVNKFYPEDFSQQEKEPLPYELKHYELDVFSTAFSEHAFSAMKIVNTQLSSKMEDDFLRSSLVVYIELRKKLRMNLI